MTDSPDPMSIALQRIAQEAEQQTGTLDLTGLNISELPEAVFDLRHLQVLRIRDWDWDFYYSGKYNNGLLLNHVRDRFKTLSELRDLSLSISDMNNLDFVAHLPKLQSLDCSGTNVADLTPLANQGEILNY